MAFNWYSDEKDKKVQLQDDNKGIRKGAAGRDAVSVKNLIADLPKTKLSSKRTVQNVRLSSGKSQIRPPVPTYDAVERESARRPTDNKIVVAAIDFGTTYSGYAFSFKHEYLKDPLRINANLWTNVEQGKINAKTPTCLLLDPDQKLHSFGNEAKMKYESLLADEENKDWYFFREFKMTLHQEKEIKKGYVLTEENGKMLDALTVFSLSIQALKNRFMEDLKKACSGDFRDSDVKWVITVPAIWNDSAKKFMRQAAEKAGIRKDSIEIALEPEAASIFCRQLPITRDPQTVTGMTRFPQGTRYLVLDCGGGTVDVTVHEVLENNKLKELHKASGGNWGGTFVNKSFLKFVSDFVGLEAFDEFCKNHQSDYLELVDEFENKKRTFSGKAEKITLRIPATLQKLFGNASEQPLSKEDEAEQSSWKHKVRQTNDKLRIDADLFESFFEQAVSGIKVHVEELMKALPRPVEKILMVGGFSESLILQKAIKTSFADKEVIVPTEASLCVLKGAVIYGHQPSMITERKSRYTYGVAMTVPFDKTLHPNYRKVIGDGSEWCDGVFDKHVEIGESIKTNDAKPLKEYRPMSNTDFFLPVYLFRSTKKDPKFVDEESCEFVGEFHVKRKPGIGKTSRSDNINVRLQFGGSDIKVEAVRWDGSVESAEFVLKD